MWALWVDLFWPLMLSIMIARINATICRWHANRDGQRKSLVMNPNGQWEYVHVQICTRTLQRFEGVIHGLSVSSVSPPSFTYLNIDPILLSLSNPDSINRRSFLAFSRPSLRRSPAQPPPSPQESMGGCGSKPKDIYCETPEVPRADVKAPAPAAAEAAEVCGSPILFAWIIDLETSSFFDLKLYMCVGCGRRIRRECHDGNRGGTRDEWGEARSGWA